MAQEGDKATYYTNFSEEEQENDKSVENAQEEFDFGGLKDKAKDFAKENLSPHSDKVKEYAKDKINNFKFADLSK